MTSRVCSVPGCPVISDKPRCPAHRRAAEQARGTRKDRGYDAAHIREGNAWRAKVRAGELVTCWRCGQPIVDASDLHLGHDDRDRTITRGPEHGRACNLSAAGKARHGISPGD